MDATQKTAIAGMGLIAAGVGLGMVGAALIVPAMFVWGARFAEKGADRLGAELEGASKKIGTAAGTLHRSFNEAKKAGVSEFKRSA